MRPCGRRCSRSYRMVGSVADAEDVVQEAFLRHQRALDDGAAIRSPSVPRRSSPGSRSTISPLRARPARNLCRAVAAGAARDRQRRRPGGARRGGGHAVDGVPAAAERLSPVERAVFLLHDVFGYGYDEIAGIVGKTESNCRQLAVRARRRSGATSVRRVASAARRARRTFLRGRNGRRHGQAGRASRRRRGRLRRRRSRGRWLKPIVRSGSGRSPADRLGSAVRLGRRRTSAEAGERPARCRRRGRRGPRSSVFALDIADGVVQTVRSVIQPRETSASALADVRALMRQSRR